MTFKRAPKLRLTHDQGDLRFTPTTLSDAPGDKQPGATLSLPPPMGSHRVLAGWAVVVGAQSSRWISSARRALSSSLS